ncbi:MAG: SDR family oxidoreductase [Euryarchaeota archaeon]|jgi:NAD(P)-dependent dehydrogenase (short-subunit alcohol dehydrogenase family)|nr:SDR family oxidoreductase [Euryarchaeota archaeon]MBT5454408.1 SDR family oxidoreductase [Euryarchaeota archaeon]MBT6255726.1 SDR family oxidoreductase [Euryarchaeota archaeon]MBT6527681.1 SDR family oxidoreductase [Euryarchaeota archaeon]MBT7961737.1 SDR family oxidoreductase [Euryarchaeota archaeon]
MRVAVVTGANRGLGAEWTHQLLEDGWQVYAGYRSELGRLTALSNENLTTHVLDVQSNDSVQLFAKNAPLKIDLLVNNAGVADGRWRNLTEIDDEWALEVLNINALGPVRVVKSLYPKMKHNSLTKIAMISSLMASIDDCHMGRSYAYRASKTALNMFTVSMKKEALEDNISFVILHPGWVKTDMGGDRAPVEIPESVTGMRNVLETRTLENTGEFVQFDGELLPW